MTTTERRIAVLRGGPSAERDVSMASGQQVLDALGGDAVDVTIDANGQWAVDGVAYPRLGVALDALVDQADVAFIALHGPFGEDGAVQGLLEGLGLPYTGSGVAASGLAMDKPRAKAIYRDAGLPTAPAVTVSPGAFAGHQEALAERIEAVVGLPCVVKPACDGSSFGVSFPEDRDMLLKAIEPMVLDGRVVIAERRLQGTELTCGVLEHGDGPRALPVTEIAPTEGYAFFDYEAKYTPGATEEITPARISDALRDRVQALAIEAHVALGCRDMSRTDFIVEGGEPWLLETNTIPGLTANSLLPQAAAAAGLSFEQLIRHIVARARARA